MAKKRTFLWNLLVDQFWKSIVRLEKLLKYLVWIICKPISSLKLTLSEKPFSKLLPTILVVKSPFDWITENFVCLWDFWEMMIRCFMILFCEFRMPSEYFFLITLSYIIVVRVPLDPKNLIVIFHHFVLDLYFYNLFYFKKLHSKDLVYEKRRINWDRKIFIKNWVYIIDSNKIVDNPNWRSIRNKIRAFNDKLRFASLFGWMCVFPRCLQFFRIYWVWFVFKIFISWKKFVINRVSCSRLIRPLWSLHFRIDYSSNTILFFNEIFSMTRRD